MGTEGIQDKYINPYADFGFKLLFGTAMNKELFEAAEIAKFNPKELGEYWESLKNFRDWYSVMSTQLKKGREEGLKEGLEKGLEQGRKEECFKNAKKMKQADLRLLAIPASWGRVADPNPNWDIFYRFAPSCDIASYCICHCSTCVALDIRAMMT